MAVMPFQQSRRLLPQTKLQISNIHRQANAQNKVMCAISAQPTLEYCITHSVFTTYIAHEDLCYPKPICHSKETGKQDISESSRPVILLDFLPPEYIIVVYLHIQTFPMKSSYHNEITHLHYKVIKGEQKYSKIFVEPNAKILEFFRGTSLDVKINSSFHPLEMIFRCSMETWTLFHRL